MKVIICGGREYTVIRTDRDWLDTLDITYVIHGAARGADTGGAAWAVSRKIPQIGFPANWTGDGRAAGPIRNQRMLDHLIAVGDPDGFSIAVIAFPGGRGTADMVRRARAAGVRVIERGTVGGTE